MDNPGGTAKFIFNKLITGGFRVGVSQKLDDPLPWPAPQDKTRTRAGASAHGNWHPDDHNLAHAGRGRRCLLRTRSPALSFYLAYGLEASRKSWVIPQDWREEWKWAVCRGPN